jgi:hypothetical protein
MASPLDIGELHFPAIVGEITAALATITLGET